MRGVHGKRVEGRARAGQQPAQQRGEAVDADRRGAVHRLGAAPLQQQSGRGDRRVARRRRAGRPCDARSNLRRVALAAVVAAGFGCGVNHIPLDAVGAEPAGAPAPRAGPGGIGERGIDGAARMPPGPARLAPLWCDEHQARRLFGLGAVEVRVPIDADERGKPRRRPAGDNRARPSHERRSHPHGRHGVPDVVLAVAERAFAVLPGLTPVDRRQRGEEAALWQPCRRGRPRLRAEHAAFVERVRIRRVVDRRRLASPATPGPQTM